MTLPNILNRIIRRVSIELYSPTSWLKSLVVPSDYPILRLGSLYGGWDYLSLPGLQQCIIISCGAGEDISFDLEFQVRHDAKVVIVDPTPKAILHFRSLKDAILNGDRATTQSGSHQEYDLQAVNIAKLVFVEMAVWSENTTLKFWAPRNQNHVSHSLVNLQKSDNFISINAENLFGICAAADVRPSEVELIKLDIEGSEQIVLNWMMENNFKPRQILVEFDEMLYPTSSTSRNIKAIVDKLKLNSYQLVNFDGRSNCLFVRTA